MTPFLTFYFYFFFFLLRRQRSHSQINKRSERKSVLFQPIGLLQQLVKWLIIDELVARAL